MNSQMTSRVEFIMEEVKHSKKKLHKAIHISTTMMMMMTLRWKVSVWEIIDLIQSASSSYPNAKELKANRPEKFQKTVRKNVQQVNHRALLSLIHSFNT